jgi:hypothetical protein
VAVVVGTLLTTILAIPVQMAAQVVVVLLLVSAHLLAEVQVRQDKVMLAQRQQDLVVVNGGAVMVVEVEQGRLVDSVEATVMEVTVSSG